MTLKEPSRVCCRYDGARRIGRRGPCPEGVRIGREIPCCDPCHKFSSRERCTRPRAPKRCRHRRVSKHTRAHSVAALSTSKEQRRAREAHTCEHVSSLPSFPPKYMRLLSCSYFSIRFAPPLVISEEDMLKAVDIIGECLRDLDKVCAPLFVNFISWLTRDFT